MVKARKIVYDVKTGEKKVEEFEFTPVEIPEILKGLDIEKLKEALVKKGIITDKREIE